MLTPISIRMGFKLVPLAASAIVAKPLLEPCRMTISGVHSFGVTTWSLFIASTPCLPSPLHIEQDSRADH